MICYNKHARQKCFIYSKSNNAENLLILDCFSLQYSQELDSFCAKINEIGGSYPSYLISSNFVQIEKNV